jgi:hypothetical protein
MGPQELAQQRFVYLIFLAADAIEDRFGTGHAFSAYSTAESKCWT